ncbi:dihydrofolate reductase family protein [Microbacterium jejuense]|uniref:dihydrofolate reductase family protein n=1 Tax=Microbacterium jejuense TaxID=1263637 RepID=UPI0031F0A933
MTNTVLYMSMSLDGYIAGPNETDDNGLGDGGGRLHEWAFPPQGEVNRQILDEFMSTGAVVAGRGTFEPAQGWQGDHHDGVPIWVLSRRPVPAWADSMPLVEYTNDIASAFAQARRAAGEKDVLVHGAATAQRAIAAGLLDEIEIHLVPVLFGAGRRLFEGPGLPRRELERVRALSGEGGVTHLRFRVRY